MDYGRHPVVESLVFEGGGVRGLAYIGGVQYLEEIGVLKRVENFAGSSAGAIIACLLACSYNSKELYDILENVDMTRFLDGYARTCILKPLWKLRGIRRVMKRFGYHPGAYFEKWFDSLLFRKTGIRKITFGHLYNLTRKRLVITGSCINKQELHLYHHESNPQMPVSRAVRISMSIPLVFEPVVWKKDVLIDGGIFNNYPLFVFNDPVLPNTKTKMYIRDTEGVSKHTLGLKLMEMNEKVGTLSIASSHKVNTTEKRNIGSYLHDIFNGMFLQIERMHMTSAYWEQTAVIRTDGVGIVEFDMSKHKKEALIQSGYEGVKTWFTKSTTSTSQLENKSEE
jgi:NTE family protein